jgi:hypothetical protein
VGQPDNRNIWQRYRPLVGIAAVLVIVFTAGLALASRAAPSASTEIPPTAPEARTLASFRQVDDYPLYVMTHYGASTPEDLAIETGRAADLHGDACSTFTARTPEGDVIVGRNFDWIHRAALLLFTEPPDGPVTASMVDIAYLGYEDSVTEDADRSALLDAPRLPMDGMNEQGLAVTQMAIPDADQVPDPDRPTVGSLGIMRVVLDGAATVDEAIEVMGGYNVDFEGGPDLHYLVADASGASAVVEFVGGDLVVTRSDMPWQISTNFTLYGTEPEEWPRLCQRYATAQETLGAAGGELSVPAAMDLLASVSQAGGRSQTMWSVVYNLTAGSVDVVVGREYETVHSFALGAREE